MEDTTAVGPVAVQTAGLKEAITFLEKEMVSNELLLVLRAHRGKRVERTLEITIEAVACLNDSLHDLVTISI